MTLTIKLDRNWSSFQLANSAPPLSVTGSAIGPSARMQKEEAAPTALEQRYQTSCLGKAPEAEITKGHSEPDPRGIYGRPPPYVRRM